MIMSHKKLRQYLHFGFAFFPFFVLFIFPLFTYFRGSVTLVDYINDVINFFENFFDLGFFITNPLQDFFFEYFGVNVGYPLAIIFYILDYEIIIDLVFLFYEFIVFILDFASKYLEGIYEKI